MYKNKEEQRKYQREWVAKRRLDWLTANGPCKQCGSSDKLELDHIDPELKVAHSIWSWSENRRNEELAKCQVLCEKCHLEKTIKQVSTAKHGSISMYTYQGCRCELCKACKLASSRKWSAIHRPTKNKRKSGRADDGSSLEN